MSDLREQASALLTPEAIRLILHAAWTPNEEGGNYHEGKLALAALDALQPLFEQVARERDKLDRESNSWMADFGMAVQRYEKAETERDDLRAKLTQAEAANVYLSELLQGRSASPVSAEADIIAEQEARWDKQVKPPSTGA
jgi:hypothetical protein